MLGRGFESGAVAQRGLVGRETGNQEPRRRHLLFQPAVRFLKSLLTLYSP